MTFCPSKLVGKNPDPVLELLALRLEKSNAENAELREVIRSQKEQIRILKDEIAALKNSPKKPKFQAKKRKNNAGKQNEGSKRPGSEKKAKKSLLRIDETKVIAPPDLPDGSRFKRRRKIVIQDLIFKSHNTEYILEEWETPSGEIKSAQLPAGISQGHFGNTLCCFMLHQHYHCQVTQPLLREQLLEVGIDISIGQVNNILIENKDIFHKEKDEILTKGLDISDWIQTDDTGARHKGKTGYCTHVGNHLFAWFDSSESKSRIHFLTILNRAFDGKYVLNKFAFRYMKRGGLPQDPLNKLENSIKIRFDSKEDWDRWLKHYEIDKPRHIKIATEAALFGGAISGGMNQDLAILSDDARQFNIPLMIHALCWVHEIRHIKNLIPENKKARKARKDILDEIHAFYQNLKKYRENPGKPLKSDISKSFNKIFTTKTCFASLNIALKRIYNKKEELLVVLDRPNLPLHNNASEADIREFVKKRKMSGGTRSDTGRKCRDTFASLKKTCRKLGVSFWNFLSDRLSGSLEVKRLTELMTEKAAENSCREDHFISSGVKT